MVYKEFDLDPRDKCCECANYIDYPEKLGICRVTYQTKRHKWPYILDNEGYVVSCPSFRKKPMMLIDLSGGE